MRGERGSEPVRLLAGVMLAVALILVAAMVGFALAVGLLDLLLRW